MGLPRRRQLLLDQLDDVLGDVVRACYDRDLAEVIAAPGHGTSGLGLGCPGIVLERDAGGWSASLPSDTGFDPGGIGLGFCRSGANGPNAQ